MGVVSFPRRLLVLVVAPVLMALAACTSALAQTTPNASWAVRFGGPAQDVPRSVTTLSDGSTVVTGQVRGVGASFGPFTLSSAGDSDIFVARINTDGTFAWAFRSGGTGLDAGFHVIQRPDGALLVTGYFTGNVTFNGVNLTNNAANTQDVFVAALDPTTGTPLWVRTGGGTGNDYVYRVRAMPDNSLIAVGSAQVTATFGPTTLPPSLGNGDLFAMRINADGSYRWVKRLGGSTDFDDLFGLWTFADGSFAATGYIRRSATFGTTTLTPATPGAADVVVLKMDADGNVVWAKRAGGPSTDDFAYTAAGYPDGSILIGGYFSGVADFGPYTLTSAGGQDAFVAKYAADGTVLWVRAGNNSSGDDFTRDLVTRPDGSTLALMQFKGTFTYSGQSVTSNGDTDVLAAVLDSTGAITWRAQRGGTGADTARYIHARPDGFFTTTGSFSGIMAFASSSLASAGSEDGFVEGFLFVPEPPARPTIVVGSGSATATIEPTPGGSVTEYDITAHPSGNNCEIIPPATSCTITGLQPGVTYAFTTVATNAAGRSESSEGASATIPGGEAPPADTPAPGASAEQAAVPTRVNLGPLRGRTWRIGYSVITAGAVPAGATSVVQAVRRATGGATATGLPALRMRPCAITGPAFAQRYRCTQRLRPGAWQVVTEARAADGQRVRLSSNVTVRASQSPAVTG